MSGVERTASVLVGIAWWKIDRAVRRWAEAIIGRIDALEERLARIEGNTAKDRKDLGTLPRGWGELSGSAVGFWWAIPGLCFPA